MTTDVVIPPSMEIAQEAIQLPEVKAMIRRLADFNLGVCMPHLHPEPGVFEPLPVGTVALERKSDFLPEDEIDKSDTVPVAWQWSAQENAVAVAGSCHLRLRKCD